MSVAESSRVATVADVLSKAATKKELNTLASFSLVWNAREEYPSAGQRDAFKLGFTDPESKEESAKERNAPRFVSICRKSVVPCRL